MPDNLDGNKYIRIFAAFNKSSGRDASSSTKLLREGFNYARNFWEKDMLLAYRPLHAL